MTLDHIKYAVPATNNFVTMYFGRIAFPIFAFLVAEGMIHTKSRKKYLLRMTIFAVISQIPYILFRGLISDRFVLNIMFTFLFAIIGIMIFDWFEKLESYPSFLKFITIALIASSILMMTNFISIDYGWYGISTVWLFYVLKDKKILRTLRIYYFSLLILFFKIYWIFKSVRLYKFIFCSITCNYNFILQWKRRKEAKILFLPFLSSAYANILWIIFYFLDIKSLPKGRL